MQLQGDLQLYDKKEVWKAYEEKEKAVRYITYYNGTNHNAASSSGSRCSNICF